MDFIQPSVFNEQLSIEYERDDAIPLASRSTAEQELLLLDDFLHAALGLDGRYVIMRRAANESHDNEEKERQQ